MGLFSVNHERIVRENTEDLRNIPINPGRTVVVNMNTVNGYLRFGNMASPALGKAVEQMLRVNEYFMRSRKIFAIDAHSKESPELKNFPDHCTSEEEREVADELAHFVPQGDIMYKNSANLFVAFDYVRWLAENKRTADNFVIVGGMTDIDVLQFALSQKAYFNENNRRGKVIVIENAVRTFSSDAHDGASAQTFALYNMMINGISLAKI